MAPNSVFLVMALVLLAGCATPGPLSPAATNVAHVPIDSAAHVETVAPTASGLHPRILPTREAAFEPSMGITPNGDLFVVAMEKVVRSVDAGASWSVVHDLAKARVPENPVTTAFGLPFTSDPWLWVDNVTGRVFSVHLQAACSLVSWSDNAGVTWSNEVPACPSATQDFQKLVTGRPGPVPNARVGTARSIAYLCYNNNVVPGLGGPVSVDPGAGRHGLSCAASYDGGHTWENEVDLSTNAWAAGATASRGCGGGGAWAPAVAPDGTVVVRGQPDCLFATRDSGASWQLVGRGPPFEGTQMAFDDAGTLYAMSGWWAPPLRLARSEDGGRTWAHVWTIQPRDVGTVAFPALVAGAPGRVAVAFLGTNETLSSPDDANETTRWHAWFATTTDALSDAPTFEAMQASPDDAPLHVGCISRSSPCPFMGDFVTMAASPEGTPFVVFPDTCNAGCEGNANATMKDARDPLATVVALDGWKLRG